MQPFFSPRGRLSQFEDTNETAKNNSHDAENDDDDDDDVFDEISPPLE